LCHPMMDEHSDADQHGLVRSDQNICTNNRGRLPCK
jgi:hypothetical protein